MYVDYGFEALSNMFRNKSVYFFPVARNVFPLFFIFVSVEISANERLSRPYPHFLVLDASSTLPHSTPTAPAMFPGKRRTLEILARNVGSGGREAAVETHGGGKGGLPGWEAFHFLGDFRQTRRFRHIGADADATVDVESVRVPALPGSGSGLSRPRFTPAVPTVVSTRASTHAPGRTESFRSLSPTFSFRFRSYHPLRPSAPCFSAAPLLVLFLPTRLRHPLRR